MCLLRGSYPNKIISDNKVFVCSWALALQYRWALAQLRALL